MRTSLKGEVIIMCRMVSSIVSSWHLQIRLLSILSCTHLQLTLPWTNFEYRRCTEASTHKISKIMTCCGSGLVHMLVSKLINITPTRWLCFAERMEGKINDQHWNSIVFLNLDPTKLSADTLWSYCALSAGSKSVDTIMPEVALITWTKQHCDSREIKNERLLNGSLKFVSWYYVEADDTLNSLWLTTGVTATTLVIQFIAFNLAIII